MYAANLVTENGDSFIPASQRPDGTWRKARRVKEGYVPQEEVPLYESKGKQFLNQQAKPIEPVRLPSGHTAHRTIPGLFITDDKDKEKKPLKKKNKKVEEITNRLDATKITTTTTKVKQSATTTTNGESAKTDPTKRLKNLKKRLREIEALEKKVKGDDKLKLEPEQIAKLQRKKELLKEIADLEKTLQK